MTETVFGAEVTRCLARNTRRDYEDKNSPFFIFEEFFPPLTNKHNRNSARIDSPMVDTVNQKIIYILFLYTFSLQYCSTIFSVRNDGIEWCLFWTVLNSTGKKDQVDVDFVFRPGTDTSLYTIALDDMEI